MLRDLMVKGYIEAAAFFFYWFIVMVNKTLRLKVIGAEHYYSLKKAGKKIVFIFWHQATFIPFAHYHRQKACILAMKHIKGEILARMAERLGYQVVRLEKENDRVGFLQMLRLAEKGYDCNIAVDGPTGPCFKMRPGAVMLAQKLNYPLLPVAAKAFPRMALSWRWDKYFIPLPFARAVLIFSEPIDPSKKRSRELLTECEEILNRLTRQAEEALT